MKKKLKPIANPNIKAKKKTYSFFFHNKGCTISERQGQGQGHLIPNVVLPFEGQQGGISTDTYLKLRIQCNSCISKNIIWMMS